MSSSRVAAVFVSVASALSLADAFNPLRPPAVSLSRSALANDGRSRARRSSGGSTAAFATEVEVEVTEDDIKDFKRKFKAQMIAPDGKPYAPWMMQQMEAAGLTQEEAIVAFIKRNKIKEMNAQTKKIRSAAEINENIKLTQIADDEVLIEWSTEEEKDVVGFKIFRRPIAGDDFTLVNSYETFDALKSKGAMGGVYRIIEDELTSGEWVYKVTAITSQGRSDDVALGNVQVLTADERNKQRLLTIGVLGAAALMIVAFFFADQPNLS
ncbi:unnamed protein product [Vitrella brassicaformis CCMP3155]|uniref:Fibronectin type-III domain-containing protein n=1 Tax=Vitrella brassicaformis (strain CCMP3155) TaxID=1169540 RepID=A0A0G4H1G7_VITBC|nr:unnamed protein product [Vitrella brassicaformis CCMP3155]|eukprot:CEM37442.1 unnamed protein product [Vitrella brassicaformis CCMP3155]